MGVDVVLKRVGRAGTSPKKRRLTQLDVVLDEADVFAGVCAGSGLPMLSRVDPYGDLVLTGEEMPQFIAEVEVEWGRAAEPQRGVLAEVRRLAEWCAAEPSTELHLEGD
ncbi:hypothetical protein [Kribbella sp. NPDC023855]|uniref:hypothetical protein n=1 Tax=Kribbella sp. NPDC023855 TaxID=3154698 RepID=UPI0033FBA0ED